MRVCMEKSERLILVFVMAESRFRVSLVSIISTFICLRSNCHCCF